MHIVLFGLDHDVASVALRERVAFPGHEVPEALCELRELPHVAEVALLSTCNRTEFYAVAEDPLEVRAALTGFLSARSRLSAEEIARAFRWHEGAAAALHLLRVAAGLESQILGEGQILGQVREAARLAREAGTLGPLLDALFRQSLSAGKRVRSETELSRGAVSVGSAAVELARETLGGLEGRSALLMGAGKLGELALRQLGAQGVSRIVVANRTLEAAAELATVVGGEAVPFSGLQQALREVDVVLCCTGAPHYVLYASDLEAVMRDRGGRSLIVVDISVPRNIDPAAGAISGLTLFDIDQLAAVADRNRVDRADLVPQAEAIVAQEREAWARFMRSYQAAPTITGLRQKIEALRAQELEAFKARHGAGLSPEQLAAVEQLTRALAAKFLHDPTVGLRERGDGAQSVHAAAIRELFGLTFPRESARAARSR